MRIDGTELPVLNKEVLDHDMAALVLIDMSWSRLDTYQRCPARYKYKYCEGRQEQSTTPLAIGKTVHSALEDIVKYRVKDEIEAEGFFLQAVERLGRDGAVLSQQEVEDGSSLVKGVMHKMQDATDNDLRRVIDVEWGFRYIIGRGLFLGFIDLVFWDEDEDGKFIHIIDYKTGKNKYPIVENGQMKLYTLATKARFPEERVKASLYWVRDNQVDTIEFTDEELFDFKEETADVIAYIIDDTEYHPTKEIYKCSWCSFAEKDICKFGYRNKFIMKKAKEKRERAKQQSQGVNKI